MTVSRGRELLEASISKRLELHRQGWPEQQLQYQELVGRVLARVLAGEPVISDGPASNDEPPSISVSGLSSAEAALLNERLAPDKPAAGFARWAFEIARAVRVDPRFARSYASLPHNYVRVTDGTTLLVVSVLTPILSDLAGIFRIRSGEGPRTLKGRKGVVERSVQAHLYLGLDGSLVSSLIDPTLDSERFIEARRSLVQGWAITPPDLGERALAMLCQKLASSYYSKALKDGTARRAQVINQNTEPLLKVTLNSWDALLAYLGEVPSDADANPMPVRPTVLPPNPPEEVARRIKVAREWFLEVLDVAHTKQEPGDSSLWGLVPESHISPNYDSRTWGDDFDPDLWITRLPAGMGDEIWKLWGTDVLSRHPDVLIDNPYPDALLAEVLNPAAQLWESIFQTCWFLCFGPGSRTSLDQLREYNSHALDELAKLGCPVEGAVFDDLIETGKGHEWLLEPEFLLEFTVSIGESPNTATISEESETDTGNLAPGEIFRKLRSVVTHHRAIWLEKYLDDYLDVKWKRDLSGASRDYQELTVGRGRPPSLRQAFPKLNVAAKRWFGGDIAKLARSLDMEGPVAELTMRRSDRSLPGDVKQIRLRVNELLGGELRPEGEDAWSKRRRHDLSLQVGTVLALWQASGELPSRPAFKKDWLLREAFPEDFENGYLEYIEAVRHALDEVGHEAASAPLETRSNRAGSAGAG